MVPKWEQNSVKNAIFGLFGRLGGTWGAFRAPGGEKTRFFTEKCDPKRLQEAPGALQGGSKGGQGGPKEAKREAPEAPREGFGSILVAKRARKEHLGAFFKKKAVWQKNYQNLSKMKDFHRSEG